MRRWSYGFVLLGAVSLISCAQPEKVSYSDVAAQKEHLLIERDRVSYTPRDVESSCGEEVCEIPVSEVQDLVEDVDRMEGLIEELNNEADALVQGHNSLVRALVECEYGKATRDQTIEYQDDLAFKQEIISGAKQLILITGCAAFGLW